MHVPLHILESLDISPLEPVLLKSCHHHQQQQQQQQQHDEHEIKPAAVSIIVQAVPRMDEYSGSVLQVVINKEHQQRSNVARLLPFLEEFLVCAAEKFDNDDNSAGTSNTNSTTTRISSSAPTRDRHDNVVIVQYVQRCRDGDGLFNEARIVARPFIIEKIHPDLICDTIATTGTGNGPSTNQTYRGFQVSLQLICTTNEEYDIILNRRGGDADADADAADDYYHSHLMSQVKDGLESRTIQKGSFIAINLPCIQGLSTRRQRSDECAIFYISNVELPTSESSCKTKEGMFYELGSSDDFEVSLHSLPLLAKDGEPQSSHGIDKRVVGQQRTIECCPGYESLVQEIVEIAIIKLRQGAPSGIIISGCSGVGKSRLVSMFFFFFLSYLAFFVLILNILRLHPLGCSSCW